MVMKTSAFPLLIDTEVYLLVCSKKKRKRPYLAFSMISRQHLVDVVDTVTAAVTSDVTAISVSSHDHDFPDFS